MRLKFSIALLLAVAPALASAYPTTGARVRTQSYHDHTPKARVRVPGPHRS